MWSVQWFIRWHCHGEFASYMCIVATSDHFKDRVVCIIAIANHVTCISVQEFCRVRSASGKLIVKNIDIPTVCCAVTVEPHSWIVRWFSAIFVKHLQYDKHHKKTAIKLLKIKLSQIRQFKNMTRVTVENWDYRNKFMRGLFINSSFVTPLETSPWGCSNSFRCVQFHNSAPVASTI